MRSYICVDKNVEKDETFPFLNLLKLFFGKMRFPNLDFGEYYYSLFLIFLFFSKFLYFFDFYCFSKLFP